MFNTLSPSKSPNIGKPFCCFILVFAVFSGFPINFLILKFEVFIPNPLLIFLIVLFFWFVILDFLFIPIPNALFNLFCMFIPANGCMPILDFLFFCIPKASVNLFCIFIPENDCLLLVFLFFPVPNSSFNLFCTFIPVNALFPNPITSSNLNLLFLFIIIS